MNKLLSIPFKFFFFVLLTIPSFGQSDSYKLSEILTTEDGLPHNYITCLKRYEIGILLVGTQNGFILYDGYEFELFNSDSLSFPKLNNNNINSIAFDKEQNAWIGSDNGLNKVQPFAPKNKSIFNVDNPTYPPLKTPYVSKTFLTSSPEIGDIWIVNNGIICQLIDDKIKQYYPEKYNEVSQIICDNEGNVYALTKDFLIGLDANGKLLFEINQFSSPLNGTQRRANMTQLFKTKKGEIILEDFLHKRYFKINSSGKIDDITIENHWLPKLFSQLDQQALQLNIKSLRKFDIVETDHNLIWVATNFGLAKVEVRQDFFGNISELDGISCRDIIQAEDGNIYGGTFSPFNFYSYNPKTKKFKWIKNNLNATELFPLNNDSILVIGDNGHVRIFSQSKQKIIKEVESPKDTHFKTVFRDKDDKLWFGGRKNNLYYSTISNPLKFIKVKLSKNDFVIDNLVREICSINDSTFLLASNNGMAMFNKKQGTEAVFHDKSTKDQRVLNNIIGQFIKDKNGNVWIATDGGLNYFDVFEKKITKGFTMLDGLPSNIIYSLVMENDSIIWLGTANGLSKFNIKKESFTNYFIKEGIADNEFNSNSFVKSDDGKIYMGGIKGITIIDSQKLKLRKKPDRHFIVRYLKYNSKNGKLNRFFLNPANVGTIYLKPYESFIDFHFVNENLTSPRRNIFSYKMEGYDKKWIPKTRNNEVRYANLPAGNYTFKLKSANANGLENNEVFEVSIIVEQYFYKSRWFLFLMVALLLLSLIGVYQYRFNLLRKNIGLRNKLARDLHDEMSNTFNNIRIIAKESDSQNVEKTKADMNHIHSMSSNSIELVEDVIWSLNRENHTVGNLIMKLEDFLDDVLKSKNIPFTFERINIDEEGNLNYLYRRNLILIFKEAITNIVKHTKPTNVQILFKDQPDTILYQVSSTFSETRKAKYSTGLGIPGMRQRAEFINATIEFKKGKNTYDMIMIMKKVKKRGLKKNNPFLKLFYQG